MKDLRIGYRFLTGSLCRCHTLFLNDLVGANVFDCPGGLTLLNSTNNTTNANFLSFLRIAGSLKNTLLSHLTINARRGTTRTLRRNTDFLRLTTRTLKLNVKTNGNANMIVTRTTVTGLEGGTSNQGRTRRTRQISLMGQLQQLRTINRQGVNGLMALVNRVRQRQHLKHTQCTRRRSVNAQRVITATPIVILGRVLRNLSAVRVTIVNLIGRTHGTLKQRASR